MAHKTFFKYSINLLRCEKIKLENILTTTEPSSFQEGQECQIDNQIQDLNVSIKILEGIDKIKEEREERRVEQLKQVRISFAEEILEILKKEVK